MCVVSSLVKQILVESANAKLHPSTSVRDQVVCSVNALAYCTSYHSQTQPDSQGKLRRNVSFLLCIGIQISWKH